MSLFKRKNAAEFISDLLAELHAATRPHSLTIKRMISSDFRPLTEETLELILPDLKHVVERSLEKYPGEYGVISSFDDSDEKNIRARIRRHEKCALQSWLIGRTNLCNRHHDVVLSWEIASLKHGGLMQHLSPDRFVATRMTVVPGAKDCTHVLCAEVREKDPPPPTEPHRGYNTIFIIPIRLP